MLIPPRVTVLMSVFNAAPFLAEAISSILHQTFTDFEFLIIDDGSSDNSVEIINGFEDSRIKLICNGTNQGLVVSLNKGLEIASGLQYIARMDADDISLTDRLERQVAFMDANSDVGVCGTWLESFGSAPKAVWSPPCDDEDIKCSLLFESVLYHPTILFRKSLLEDHSVLYSSEFPHAEDYELWSRLAGTCSFSNLDTVLLQYRLHDDNIGYRESAAQQASADKVRVRLLNTLGINPSADEMALHSALSRWRVPADHHMLQDAHDWLLKLVRANAVRRIYPLHAFERVIARRWYQTCLLSTSLGFEAYRFCFQSCLCDTLSIALRHRFVFLIRALLRTV